MAFYFLSKALDETPELPAGYIIGAIDEFNPAPEGATIVETEDEVNALAAQADADNEKKIEALINSDDAPQVKAETPGNNGRRPSWESR